MTLAIPVSIFGGFECTHWTYSSNKAVFKPANTGAAITVTGTAGDVLIADLDVTAADGVAPGESSVGVFAANASKLVLRRMKVTAGTGAKGIDGAAPAPFSSSKAPDGNSGSGATPGVAVPNPLCSTSVGGAGGAAHNHVDDGDTGTVAQSSPFPNTATGIGGQSASADCTGSSLGKSGSYGPVGGPGAGATVDGILSDIGWSPSSGGIGGRGTDGQGGGGGARFASTAVAGSGAPGGCGAPAGAAKGVWDLSHFNL